MRPYEEGRRRKKEERKRKRSYTSVRAVSLCP
jgi:hypothetical protein